MKTLHRAVVPVLAYSVFCGGASAEVVTDGSLGPALNLAGPDFAIQAELGRQAGHNLFHSFSQFNVGRQESATFSGPGDVHNVIGRVTGGQNSFIDGTLRSTIPGADLFLLNPFGVLFGEHASLDVGGSLFVSSADHLEFSDGSRFSATDIGGSVLTVAPPSQFGFVSDAPAPIRVDGAQLRVNSGEGIALIGGELALSGGESEGALLAPDGSITLSSVSGPAGVTLDGEVAAGGAAADRGRVTLDQGITLDASGDAGGRIFIRGGNVVAENAVVLSQTVGASPGKGVQIQANQTITLDAANVQSATAGTGDAGPIRLEAPEITLTGSSRVVNSSFGAGRGGSTEIEAGRLRLEQGSNIENEARSSGNAGTVQIHAQESLELVDTTPDDTDATLILVSSQDEGRGGVLHINSPSVNIEGGQISATAWSSGRGGDVHISAGDLILSKGGTIFLNGNLGDGGGARIDASNGIRILGDPQGQVATGIFANTFDQGRAGSIVISAGGTIEIVGGAGSDAATGLQSSTGGNGAAGTIRVESGGLTVDQARITASTEGPGNAGMVEIVIAGDLLLDGGRIRARSVGSGSAGDVEVDAGTIELRDGAEISNEAFPGAFSSGDIRVTATDTLTIVGRGEGRDPNPGSDRVSTGIFSFTGNVTVSAPDILIRDSGAISTRTFNDEDSGRLTVTGARITLLDGAEINADSMGSSLFTGNAGDVRVSATESIRVSGETGGRLASIRAATRSDGDAGQLEVSAPLIVVENLGWVTTSTGVFGEGAAGKIVITADRLVVRTRGSVESHSDGDGAGGDVEVRVSDSLEISEGGLIAASSGDPFRGGDGQSGIVHIVAPTVLMRGGRVSTRTIGSSGIGNAGDILIEAANIAMRDGSSVESRSEGRGDAGTVTISAARLITADGSLITTGAEQSSGGNIVLQAGTIQLRGTPVTATVAGGTGDGGNVTLRAGAIAATRNSDITARADQGRGGRILIDADVFLRDATIDLDASSNVSGNEGVVEVNAPELDVSATIAKLPADFLDAAAMLRDKCAARSAAQQGSLVVGGMDGVPPGPEGYLLGPPVAGDTEDALDQPWGAQVPAASGPCLQPVAYQ